MPTGWWTQWARSWVTPSVIKCDLITFAYVNRRYDRLAVHSAKYHSVASLFDHKENLVACRTFCYCTVTQTLYFDFVFFFFLQLKLIDETQLNPNKAAFATCIWKKKVSQVLELSGYSTGLYTSKSVYRWRKKSCIKPSVAPEDAVWSLETVSDGAEDYKFEKCKKHLGVWRKKWTHPTSAAHSSSVLEDRGSSGSHKTLQLNCWRLSCVVGVWFWQGKRKNLRSQSCSERKPDRAHHFGMLEYHGKW